MAQTRSPTGLDSATQDPSPSLSARALGPGPNVVDRRRREPWGGGETEGRGRKRGRERGRREGEGEREWRGGVPAPRKEPREPEDRLLPLRKTSERLETRGLAEVQVRLGPASPVW